MATEFQTAVWDALKLIPLGRVTTYGDIARYIGRPKATRAVGTACGSNPNLVVVPCHRVVCRDGRIGQYASGIENKTTLLESEGIFVSDGRVVDFTERRFYY